MSKTAAPAAQPAPTSAAEPPAPTPTVPTDPAPPVTTEMPTQTTSDAPAPPQPGATPVPPTIPTATAAPTPAAPAEPEVPEPQNTLTEKFTGFEWKALAEFRKTVPDALAKAYTDRPDAKTTPTTLWGVRIDPANLVDARVSVVFMKFLRARNLNPVAASEMFVETLRWRDEFKVDSLLKEEFPEFFDQLGHIYGRDKEGRPVVYNVYGGTADLEAVFGDVDRFLRWRVAFMERSVALLDFATVDQAIQVHDYAGVSMSSRTPASKSAAAQASNIFASHYPELLYKKFFVNVPGYMAWLFWAFKAVLPAATVAKMSVVGSSPRSIGKALLPLVAAEELPKRYGGAADAEVFEKSAAGREK
ncbi:CRAL-TRIO domain-containing protein [Mycena rosella]|uniref:CRAL-TRIO domain-containing protein n=1 Tax=Mycena rosella TaxID=1033263 RepID=A0AAD7GNR2_MYCRO|nr:CRAL-TRIO domain-containing protein [Mycena rosella]